MKYRIDGPIPTFVTATEDGADIDISLHLVRAVFASLFEAADANPEGFGEEFADMYALSVSAQQQGRDSHAWHEFDARMEKYLAEFADEGQVRLYATGLHQLRDALAQIAAPRPLPGQRSAGAA